MTPREASDTTGVILIAAALVIGLPLLSSLVLSLGGLSAHRRKVALLASGGSALAALAAAVGWYVGSGLAVTLGPQLGGGRLVQIDGLSVLLLPFVAVLQLAIIATAPQRDFSTKAAARLLFGGALTSMFFVTSLALRLACCCCCEILLGCLAVA
jgi:hypothetical protein